MMRLTLLAATLAALTMTACGKPNQALPEQEKKNFDKIISQPATSVAPAPDASGAAPADTSSTPSTIDTAKDKAAETYDATKDKVADTIDATKEKARDIKDSVSEKASASADAVQETAADAKKDALDALKK